METEKLMNIVEETTKVYRKGEFARLRRDAEAKVDVVEIFGYPHTSAAPADGGFDKVDMLFVDVVVYRRKAKERAKELEAILKEYPQPDRLAGGPSYIELAGTLGIEQEHALRLMALGADLGMWRVMDARSLFGADEEEALELAGSGFLMVSGWTPERQKEKVR